MHDAAAASPAVSISRRRALGLLASGFAGAAGLGGLPAYAAQAWPSKPVRIIVPFAPGGGADGSARVLGEVMSPDLGQSIIVDNRPGAGGSIGVMAAVQAKDQHTLLMGSNSMVIGPLLNAYNYDVARDLDPIGMVSSQPLVLVVPASSSITSLQQLIAQAKAKPGELSAGNSGNGTLAHLTAELFALQTSVSLISVPYRGESALMPDLMSGLVSMGFLNLPSVLPHIRSQRLRALAVSSPQRVAELPDVPTLSALGHPELEVRGWAALMAPKGLSEAELGRLEKSLAQCLALSLIHI